jgi:hypothetical protein
MSRFFRAAIFLVIFLYAGSAFAAGGTCPAGANYLNSTGQPVTLANLGVTNCYYIAASGSDSNNGTSESTPWAHLPGMPTCTANCAAALPSGAPNANADAAGIGFIIRGGDTWNGSNLGIEWKWGGTATGPVYIGVDPTWYSGSSWARPIWTCGGATCTGGITSYYWRAFDQSYITVDNIEVTGLLETSTGSPNYLNVCGMYQTVENVYAHGWATQLTSSTSSQVFGVGCGTNVTGLTLRYNVADGSDTSQNMMFVTHSSTPIAYGNVMRYVVTGLDGCGDDWHDNLVEYMVAQVGGGHQDALYHETQCYSPNSMIYNNVVRHTTWAGSGGAVKLYLNGDAPCPYGSAVSSCVSYAFNNVVYDNLPGNVVDTGGHFAVNYGTWYIFNNTIDCGTDSSPGNCGLGDSGNGQDTIAAHGTMALHLINNHWISTNKSSVTGWGNLVGSCAYFTCSETNGVYQTVAAASAQGYTDSGTYAFQPTNASGSTVGTGANNQSLCSEVSAIDSNAGAACEGDTAYACAYNSTNHTVSCPAKPALTRPAGAWDVGAYQFGTTTTKAPASAPKPPQGLTAAVQ